MAKTAEVMRLSHLDHLFVDCGFCGGRPVVEQVVDGQSVVYQVRCPMENGVGCVDSSPSLTTLLLLWASTQRHMADWLRDSLLI